MASGKSLEQPRRGTLVTTPLADGRLELTIDLDTPIYGFVARRTGTGKLSVVVSLREGLSPL